MQRAISWGVAVCLRRLGTARSQCQNTAAATRRPLGHPSKTPSLRTNVPAQWVQNNRSMADPFVDYFSDAPCNSENRGSTAYFRADLQRDKHVGASANENACALIMARSNAPIKGRIH